MHEVDEDKSGTVDFFEFVNVYTMLSNGEGMCVSVYLACYAGEREWWSLDEPQQRRKEKC